MNKAVKISMLLTALILAGCAIALAVFLATFDLNDYKDRITEAVREKTGRTLSFDGELRLAVFPGLGVELGGVRLGNAEGFGPEPMLTAKSASVSVRFLPLLMRKITFGPLDLRGVVLNLSRKKDGVANWDDLVGGKGGESPERDTEEGFSLDVDGITLEGGALNWDDHMTGRRFTLHSISLKTGRIYRGAPFPVKASLAFGCTRPDVKGTVSLDGKSSIDLLNRVYGHMDMAVTVKAEGTDVPGGKGQASMKVRFAALDFKQEKAQVTDMTLSAYGVTAHAEGTLEGITTGVRKLAATVTVDEFNARKTLEAIGRGEPATADADALSKVGGMAEVDYVPGNLQVKTFQADLDGCRIVGSGGAVRKDGGETSYSANLDVGELDLDRYLPPAPAGEEGGESGLPDSEMLRRLKLDFEAKVARLRVQRMWFEKVAATIKADAGEIRAEPLSAAFYNGVLTGSATLNAQGAEPRSSILGKAKGVDIGALSRDRGGADKYEGLLDAEAALSCAGQRGADMVRTLDGKIGFSLADGVFPGVDLDRMARDTYADEDKKGTVEARGTDATRFGSITGTGVVRSGVVHNRDLEVKAPGLRADGQGAVSLVTRKVDYLVKVKLVPTGEGQGGKDSADLYGVMFPIRVGGTLDHPRYWVSLTEYVKVLGGAVLDTAGSILGGVTSVVKGVGKALVGGNSTRQGSDGQEDSGKRKKFLGIF
ncbi:AsmA family protein [Pseudodesulfovibrio cashew]|uniref:AsmA family protein n=1 Tax=Pseudodesulfovibrio cashew TaxID=2678688 RepID=A0A6I6JKP8_9BACT|nr:AsmA family protein [Pseudodesulfovibrio cashew]QGY41759.1 AsmA family protein [Pseudodesulfovibrio cashew]